MASRTLVAGVDTSTQSCKVVVCDAETGEVVRMGRGTHPDSTEVDPKHWYDAFHEAISGGLLDGVEALSVGGQQHGMVALDAAGEVVRPALLWNDTRSAEAASDLVQELGGGRAWAENVGVVPVAATTVAKLRWFATAEPSDFARTASCVLPHDWLTGRILSDGGSFSGWATDRGDASGTGYWSSITQEYRPDLVELATGRNLELPRVLGPSEAAGITRSGLVVGPGTGDNMAAALGLGLQTGDVVVSLGTSGTAFARSTVPGRDERGEVQGFADAEGGYLPLVCTLNAARVLSAAAQMLRVDLTELSELAVAASPGAGGLVLLPYLDGERTPNLPHATGTISGLTRFNATSENLARAAIEGMLCNMAQGVEAVKREGAEVRRILLIGGAAASPAVRAIAPEVFGVPVAVPAMAEYVALGAARQAAWVLSGAEAPPVWRVSVDDEREPSGSPMTAEINARYRNLLTTMHGV